MSSTLEPLTESSAGFTQLSGKQLRGFDPQIRELALRAIRAGCTARITSNRHLLLINDARLTMSLQNKDEPYNRGTKNAQAAMKRFLQQHRAARKRILAKQGVTEAEEEPADQTVQMTVKDGFLEGGQDFMRYFDSLPRPLPPDAVLEASGKPGQRTFTMIDDKSVPEKEETAEEEETAVVAETPGASEASDVPEVEQIVTPDNDAAEPEPADDDENADEPVEQADGSFVCPICQRVYRQQVSLTMHQRIHRRLRTNAYSVANIARFNETSTARLLQTLIQVGVHTDGSFPDITPEDLEAAGLKAPPVPKRFSTRPPMEPALTGPHDHSTDSPKEADPVAADDDDQSVPANANLPLQLPTPTPLTTAAAHSGSVAPDDRDPEKVLLAVRAALGPDPRIRQLEAEIGELKKQLEEKSLRIQLIQEALAG